MDRREKKKRSQKNRINSNVQISLKNNGFLQNYIILFVENDFNIQVQIFTFTYILRIRERKRGAYFARDEALLLIHSYPKKYLLHH